MALCEFCNQPGTTVTSHSDLTGRDELVGVGCDKHINYFLYVAYRMTDKFPEAINVESVQVKGELL